MSECIEGDGVDDRAGGEGLDLLLGEEGEGDGVGEVVDGVTLLLAELVPGSPELGAHDEEKGLIWSLFQVNLGTEMRK